jgi:translation elongation factor aEF-1 beta
VVRLRSGAVRNAECSVALIVASNADIQDPEWHGYGQLAKVLASIKIFPSEANIDLGPLKSKVEASLPTGSTVQRFEEEPVAFGLVALIAHIVLPEDAAGHMEQVEEAIRSVDMVSEIQVLRVGRF